MTAELLALDRAGWRKVVEDPAAFARAHAVSLGPEPDLLRAVGEQMAAMLDQTGAPDSWGGYLTVDRARAMIVGTCGFKGPPDAGGVIEIAYFTFPPFERQGYASAMAAGLVTRCRQSLEVRRVRAHTLPQPNASTRILQKLNFEHLGEIMHPEDGPIWRWERDP